MKKKKILILIILLIIGIIIWNIGFFNNNAIKSIFTGKIKENIYDVETQEAKSTSNDIYDVILFFGQSNMVGYCRQQPEKRYDPSNATSVANFSKLSGISTEILKNVGQYRNRIKITQEPGTAYIYKASTNSLEEITTSSSEQGNSIGEYLYKKKDSSGNLMLTITPPGKWDPAETWTEGKVAAETWAGVNMIPQFCQTYYKNTGHKVIAVFDAIGGVNLSAYVP